MSRAIDWSIVYVCSHIPTRTHCTGEQWASFPYSLRDEDSIKRVLEGTDVVVNMIGACICG